MMTRAQAMAIGSGSAVLGGGLLLYVVLSVPPLLPDGQANKAALLLALICLLLLAGGLGALAALALHKRWPGLAGTRRHTRARPAVALRQGALIALWAGIIVLLAYVRLLDAAYFIVTTLLLILLEAFWQSRS